MGEDYDAVLRDALRRRNEAESHAFRDITRDYAQTCKEGRELRGRAQALEGEVAGLKEDNASLKKQLAAATEAASKGLEAVALQSSNTQLQQELTASYKENAQVAQELAAVTANYQVVREENNNRGAQLVAVQGELAAAVARVSELEAAVLAAEAATQAATVELGARLEGQASAEKKAAQLEAENAQLIARWMEHKMREAEKLNEANAIYEDVVRSAQTAKTHIEAQLSEAASSGAQGGVMASLEALGHHGHHGVTAPRGVRHTLVGHEGGTHALDFDRMGARLASCGVDKTVKLWEPSSGTLVSTLRGHTATVLDVTFCPSERHVLAGSVDKTLRLWEIESGRVAHTLTGHGDKVASVTFLGNDSRSAASGGQDRTIKLWDLTKGYCTRTIMCHSSVHAVCSTIDAAIICSGHYDGALRFWDARTGKLATEVTGVHTQPVTGVSLSPLGGSILSAGRDNLIQLVDVRTFEVRKTLRSAGLRVAANWSRPCLSPDEQYVAMGSADHRVYLWDAHGKELAQGGLKGHAQPVSVCAWSYAGAPLASSDKGGMIMLWE